MQLELFFHNDCGFSKSVLNTITNLGISKKIDLKNIRENTDFEHELIEACGDATVPTLVVDGVPMRESEEIKRFLVDKFLD